MAHDYLDSFMPLIYFGNPAFEYVNSSTAYDRLFNLNIEKNSNERTNIVSESGLHGLSSLGIESIYADNDYSGKLQYDAMNYCYPEIRSKVTIDYLINNAALSKIGELYSEKDDEKNVEYYKDEFISKNMTWPFYDVLSYMNAINEEPGVITAKYDKYNKLYDSAYNTDIARAGHHSGAIEIAVASNRLLFGSGDDVNKYAKPLVFSVLSKSSAFDEDAISYGDFRIRIRNIQIPMRAFRMSDRRYVIIAPEYLFANRDQYDAITCIEYAAASLPANWTIEYSYATAPCDECINDNQKMYPSIDRASSNGDAFNLSVMATADA